MFSLQLADEIRLAVESGHRESPNPRTGLDQEIVIDSIQVHRDRLGRTSAEIVFHDARAAPQRYGARWRYDEDVERSWSPSRLATVFSLELEELLDDHAQGLPVDATHDVDVVWVVDCEVTRYE